VNTNASIIFSDPVREGEANFGSSFLSTTLKDVNGEFPFLHYQDGELVARYQADFEHPLNPVRQKIVEVAEYFDATIMTDAGDECLDWRRN
jgi:hypothetical protein